MPVYNVERYLEQCLDSILAQPVEGIEVVLVDDGSPDRSGAIAERYARDHATVRLLRQDNAGLGAARNAGVALARGRYLTFVDSDDELPKDAYSVMLRTLEATGSDFVVGRLKRDDGERRYATPRMRRNHRVDLLRTDVRRSPRLLADVFAVNKLFRRSFWDAHGLAFPVGTRYEDQPALTRAFLAATSFDVVPETVYLWRIRDDGSSITQRRDDLADLRDRVETKRVSHRLVTAAPELREVWLGDVLAADMGAYFRSVPGCSEEYWTLLRDAVRDFWDADGFPFEGTELPVAQRLMGWLVARDRRAEVEKVVAHVEGHAAAGGGRLPVERRVGGAVCLLPGLDDPGWGVPEDVYRLAPHEVTCDARLLGADRDGGLLRLRAVRVGEDPSEDEMRDVPGVSLLGPGCVVVDAVTTAADPAGFEAVVDLAGLAPGGPDGTPDAPPHRDGIVQWRVRLTGPALGLPAEGRLTSWDPDLVGPAWHDTRTLDGRVVRTRLRALEGEPVLEVRHH